MPMFRKLPVIVEAIKFLDMTEAEGRSVPRFEGPPPCWLVDAFTKDKREPGAVYARKAGAVIGSGARPLALVVRTRGCEGLHEVEPGHWLVRGIDGELYPCDPAIFERTYEYAGNHTVVEPVRKLMEQANGRPDAAVQSTGDGARSATPLGGW